MKRESIVALTVVLFILTIPLTAPAVEPGQMEEMNKGSAAHNATEGMVMLGTLSAEGVKAMGHITDASGSMAQSGMEMPHHFMVMFNDEKTGTPITDGVVAVKVTNPSGSTGDAIKLMPMSMGTVKGFGAGVKLTEKGAYKLDVGCKLADGRNRQFNFTYTLK